MIEYVSVILLFMGAVFILLSAVSVVRMPDVPSRISLASKASTLEIGCAALAVAIFYGETHISVRAIAVIIFMFLSAPVAAHTIARAAYFVGVPLWEGTVVDELRGHYDLRTHELDSERLMPDQPDNARNINEPDAPS